MRIDLFEVVDGLIRGIVYFLYNVVETTATIVRHPIKGPIRLHRSSLRQGRKQIGGLTFLFLTFMLLYSSLPSEKGFFRRLQNPSTDIFDELIHLPNFDVDRMWPAILGSLISTVVIDGTLRLIMIWRLPNRPAWRAMMLASAEYSYLWMVAALALGILVAGNSSGPSADVRILFMIPLFPLAALPAGAILHRATRRQGHSRSLPRLVAWIFVVIVPFVLAIVLGSMASFGVQFLRVYRSTTGPHTSVETLNCSVRTDARIEVYGLVSVEGAPSRALEPSDFELELRPLAIGLEPKQFVATDPAWADAANGRYVLINQNSSELVHLTFKAPPEVATETGEHYCDITVESKDGWGAIQHWSRHRPLRPRPARDPAAECGRELSEHGGRDGRERAGAPLCRRVQDGVVLNPSHCCDA
jgi:hypothetical protein